MGFINVPVKVFPPGNGREPVEVEMLVDTGGIFTLVPGRLLNQLGIEIRRKHIFQAIDGSPMERGVGVAEIEVQGEQPSGPIPVIFSQDEDSPVLGVTALESMGLKVDPAAGKLVKTDLLMFGLRRKQRS